jgi:hypothetical protein
MLQDPIRIRIRIPDPDPDPGQPNECGSMRIRILVNLQVYQKICSTYRYGRYRNRSKTNLRRHKGLFERQETRFICKFWSIFMLQDPDPDPHSQCGSGTAFPIRIRIQNSQMNADPEAQHWAEKYLVECAGGGPAGVAVAAEEEGGW